MSSDDKKDRSHLPMTTYDANGSEARNPASLDGPP